MSQTLTKPVLLDETGQAIAGKLDTNGAAIVEALGDDSALVDILNDIKDAIGISSEFIPIAIRVTTPPAKTTYITGEALDLTGIVVNLVASNGAMADITDACVFTPANGAILTSANTSVDVAFYYMKDDYTFHATQNIAVKQVQSISVTTPPTKTLYKAGDSLDLTGIVVTASYGDGITKTVTSSCVFSPADGATLATSDTSISVSYTEDGVTKTTTQSIVVKELSSIAVTTPPTKTSYLAGETLDLTGITVTATYSNGDTENVTSSCVFNPANGATLTSSSTSVSISYTDGSITKTTSQAIVIKELASIAVTTAPTKVSYKDGDALDLTGIVVTAIYDDSSTVVVTSDCLFSPANGTTLDLSNASVTVSYTEGSITKTTTQAITVSPYVYGISRSRSTSDTAWTRTNDAVGFTLVPSVGNEIVGHSDFDSVYPWSEIEIVTDYYSANNSQPMVKIPKFWFRRYIDENDVEHIEIAPKATAGFTLHPAFDRKGNQYDAVYVGEYLSYNGVPRSGRTPTTNKTRNEARWAGYSSAGNVLMDISTYSAIQMLVLVETADYDVQSVIGMGKQDSISSVSGCNYMTYKTGRRHYETDAEAQMVYRGIENLWGNGSHYIDGIQYNPSDKKYYIYNSDDSADYAPDASTVHSGFEALSYASPSNNGYFITKLGFDPDNPAYMLPSEGDNGSVTTYTTDWMSQTDGSNYAHVGIISGMNSSGRYGLFAFTPSDYSYYSSLITEGRAMKLSINETPPS